MVSSLSQAVYFAASVWLLHLWRIGLVCAVMIHEREHPALAILLLVPLNHFLFNLTASLDRSAAIKAASRTKRPRTHLVQTPALPWSLRAPLILGVYVLLSSGLIWWYGSFDPLKADARTFGSTWEWWVVVCVLIVLTVLYRPLIRELSHLVGATGLRDSRLWSALGLAIAVWVWCNGVFAALYQQLALLCDNSAVQLCQGERPFSQSLARFADAAYFSTVTLSTTGYGDVVPVSDVARALVAIEIVIGFGLLGFLLSRVAAFAPPASKPTGGADPPPSS